MKSNSSNEAVLTSILEKMGAQTSLAASTPLSSNLNATEATGEKTWQLDRIIGMLRRKGIIIGISSLIFAGLMGLRTAKDIPSFQGQFRLLVEPVVAMPPISNQLTDIKAPPPSDKGLDYTTQIEVLYSPQLLNPVLKSVAEKYPGATYDAVVPNLKVVRLGETKIIEVAYHDTNPDKAMLILKKFAQAYLEYSRDQRQRELKQSLKFVEEQLPTIQKRVNDLNQSLEELRQNYNFIEPEKQAEDLSKQIVDLAQRKQGLEGDIAAAQVRLKALQQQLGQATALSQSTKYQSLLEKFQVLEQQIAIEAARFGPNSPNIQLLQRQQENLTPILLKEAEAAIAEQLSVMEGELQILMARYQTANQTYQRLSNLYGKLPNISRLFHEYKRDLDISTNSLMRFLQTQDSLRTQLAKNDIPWQLLAEPKDLKLKPAGSPLKGMISGLVLGLIVGIILSVLLEKLENTFYSINDIKQKSHLPILGIIPFHPALRDELQNLHIVDLKLAKNHQKIGNQAEIQTRNAQDIPNWIALQDALAHKNLTLDQDRLTEAISMASLETSSAALNQQLSLEDVLIHVDSPINSHDHPEQNYWLKEYDAYGFMEAFRTLATNLNLQSLPKKSIVVTSALPHEGTSTVVAHLAQAIAAMGKRVLLVDAHLRRGGRSIRNLMNLPESSGLGDYLSDKATLIESIQKLSWESGLFVLPAGNPPADPTRLLASEKMGQLMQELECNFDLVIYATPPLMGLADVKLIAATAGTTLLVTKLGRRGSADALAHTVHRLKEAELPILGIVANGVQNYVVDLYA